MFDQKKSERVIAEYLLQINAIKLSPSSPYTWASGLKSPIYCDNRLTLSYPEVRKQIAKSFALLSKEIFEEFDVVAGVATGAIAHGVLVAEEIQLPFVYVRSAPKGHGMQNLIEGNIQPGMKVLVIEDLVSTGGSSLQAVEALKESGALVVGLMAIFTYGFQRAIDAFENQHCKWVTLTNYPVLIDVALEKEYITQEEKTLLMQWYNDPESWGS